MSAGLVGARVMVFTAVTATAVATQQPVPIDEALFGGVKLLHLIFGSIGTAVAIAIAQKWGWGKVFTAIACGLIAAAFVTPALLHYVGALKGAPQIVESGLAVSCGLVGGPLIVWVFEAVTDPIAFAQQLMGLWERWKRGGPPPGGAA